MAGSFSRNGKQAGPLVIVGGGPSALTCAMELRRHGYSGRILMFSEEDVMPYDRTLLSKDYLAEAGVPMASMQLESEDELQRLEIEFSLKSRVASIDSGEGVVTFGTGRRQRYETLVIATGARATLPAALALPGVLTLRTLRDADRLSDALARVHHLVIVGAGFIGCEVAAAALARDIEVTMLEAADEPLVGAVGSGVGAWIRRLHERQGVVVRTCSMVSGIRRRPTGWLVDIEGGETIIADAALVGAGVRPAIECVPDRRDVPSPLRTDVKGETVFPRVWATGDCATWFEPRIRSYAFGGHWDTAIRRARVVARSILGVTGTTQVLPFFWSDQYDVKLQLVGWPHVADRIELEDRETDDQLVASFYAGKRLVALLGANLPHRIAEARRWLTSTQMPGEGEPVGEARE